MSFELTCPVPITETDRILLGHGSGGRLTARLIEDTILPALTNPLLAPLEDAATIELGGHRIAMTTDSYVVTPLFFPGGDIGDLAVNGTINDLAVSGAEPLALSLSLILEEGFPIDDLRRVLASIPRAGGRCLRRHGRHEGRRSRKGGRALRQHDRDRPHSSRRTPRHPLRGAGRRDRAVRTDRRSRDHDPHASARPRLRAGSGERHGAAPRGRRPGPRRVSGHARDARSDARRSRCEPQRDRGATTRRDDHRRVGGPRLRHHARRGRDPRARPVHERGSSSRSCPPIVRTTSWPFARIRSERRGSAP